VRWFRGPEKEGGSHFAAHAAGFPDRAKRPHGDVSKKQVPRSLAYGGGVGHHVLRGTAQQVQGGIAVALSWQR
jgi:hypothetical protein